ncbi:hypothetical protein JW872_02945 [Candidatus Babeliales bacterium]|nr:hypothetical protein [Candidatus Babeliales bacterium]
MKIQNYFKAYVILVLLLWKIPLEAGWLSKLLVSLLLLSPAGSISQKGEEDNHYFPLGGDYAMLYPEKENSALPYGRSQFLVGLDLQDEEQGRAAAAWYERACVSDTDTASELDPCNAFHAELGQISRGQERFADGVPEANAQAYGRWLNRAGRTINLIRTIGEERTALIMMQVLTGYRSPTWDYSGIGHDDIPILEQFGMFHVDEETKTAFPVGKRIARLDEALRRAIDGLPLDESREALYAKLIMRHRDDDGLMPYEIAYWRKRVAAQGSDREDEV